MLYWIDQAACTGCRACESACAAQAIACDGVTATIDASQCNDCGACAAYCAVDAVHNEGETDPPLPGLEWAGGEP